MGARSIVSRSGVPRPVGPALACRLTGRGESAEGRRADPPGGWGVGYVLGSLQWWLFALVSAATTVAMFRVIPSPWDALALLCMMPIYAWQTRHIQRGWKRAQEHRTTPTS
ncbi:hypothetical protein GCM10023347_19300 [Streptomyces chumphonensis]